MAAPDLNHFDSPLGPLRDKRTITVAAADLEFPSGVIVQVATAGNLTYRTLVGVADQTETGLAANAVISVGNIPVIIRTIKGSSTVTSVVIGVV